MDNLYYDQEEVEEEYFENYEALEPGVRSWPDAVEYVMPGPNVGLTVGLIAFMFLIYLFARSGPRTTWIKEAEAPFVVDAPASIVIEKPQISASDPYKFEAPYANYVLTQGPHGQSYGHYAIDIAAGKGAAVLSPINGTIAEKYTDQWGNPTLIIENDVYEVKMLHGEYSVSVGDKVLAGGKVGIESNLGYTTDMRGVRCAGRTDYCGYHTHLNVYDKEKERNVNPLDLIK